MVARSFFFGTGVSRVSTFRFLPLIRAAVDCFARRDAVLAVFFVFFEEVFEAVDWRRDLGFTAGDALKANRSVTRAWLMVLSRHESATEEL